MKAVSFYRRLFLIILAVLIYCVSGPLAGAKIIYVKWDSAAPAPDGVSWDTAYTDIQSALNDAGQGDDIFVAAGTYTPVQENGGTGTRFTSFQLKNQVGLYGGFAGTETDITQRDIQANPTILSGDIGTALETGDNCYHVFYHPKIPTWMKRLFWTVSPSPVDIRTDQGTTAEAAGCTTRMPPLPFQIVYLKTTMLSATTAMAAACTTKMPPRRLHPALS